MRHAKNSEILYYGRLELLSSQVVDRVRFKFFRGLVALSCPAREFATLNP